MVTILSFDHLLKCHYMSFNTRPIENLSLKCFVCLNLQRILPIWAEVWTHYRNDNTVVHGRDKVHVHKFVPNDKIHRNDDYVKRVPVMEIALNVLFFQDILTIFNCMLHFFVKRRIVLNNL